MNWIFKKKSKLSPQEKQQLRALRYIEKQGRKALFWTDCGALATTLFAGVLSLLVAYFEWQTLSVLAHSKLWLWIVLLLMVCLALIQMLLLDSGFGYWQRQNGQGLMGLKLLKRLNWLFLLFLVILMTTVGYAFLIGDDGKVATWLSNFVLNNFNVG